MAKTIADKLLIKPNATLWLSSPERGDLLEPLPNAVQLVDEPSSAATGMVFAGDAASLRATLDEHRDALARPAVLWVAYPKGNRTDINRDTLWPILTEYGMRPVSQVALDEVWSALRFRPIKPGEKVFTGGR